MRTPLPPLPREPAFTLLELLVALSLVMALAAVSLGAVHALRGRAAVAQTRSELAILSLALEAFKRRHGDYPAAESDSASAALALYRALSGEAPSPPAGGQQPVFEVGDIPHGPPPDEVANDNPGFVFLDPWGQPYRYFFRPTTADADPEADPSSSAHGYILLSAGPDGRASLPTAAGSGEPNESQNADNVRVDDVP